jgi:hypothetical protein
VINRGGPRERAETGTEGKKTLPRTQNSVGTNLSVFGS